MNTENSDSPAIKFLQVGWDSLPYRSHRNVNSVMSQILQAAISGGMQFNPGDFSEIYKRFRAQCWIGESREGFYSLACEERSGANISAAIAYETHAGRPAVLWPESTKTPERLHVRSQFNWKGMRLEITSMAKDHLIGCTYKGDRSNIEIKNRVRVTYADIQSARKEFDNGRRKWEREITTSNTLEALDEVAKRFAAGDKKDFRHFDVEMIRELYRKTGNAMREKLAQEESEERQRQYEERRGKEAETHDADLARWVSGENVHRHFDVVRLRVKGDGVETSTGFVASVAAVREAIPFVKRFRSKGWHSNGAKRNIDEHPITEVRKTGVMVGCTFVEWSEIDRISKLV